MDLVGLRNGRHFDIIYTFFHTKQFLTSSIYLSCISVFRLCDMYGAMGTVGQQRRAMDQSAIDAAKAKYAYEAQLPVTGIQNYLAGISGEYGGTSTATGPAGPNPLVSALAGGIGMSMGGPIGAAAGNAFANWIGQ